jgi:glycosyltransferase involved in cell wall biosynthesis
MGKSGAELVKILFLSPWFPTPPVNGSKIRLFHLLSALCGRHEVSLVSFVREGEVIDIPTIASLCAEVRTVPFREFHPEGWRARLGYLSRDPRSVVDTYNPEIERLVRNLTGGIDCIVANQMVTASYSLQNSNIPCVLDELELATGWDAWQKASGLARLRHWLTWQKTRRYVRRLLPRFKAVTVVSEVEKAIVGEVAPEFKRLRVVPNGVDTEYNRPGLAIAEADRLVYSGALTYSANYDAVKFFLEEIFPLIRNEQPHACVEITGSAQGVNLEGLRLNDQARLTGYIEDIRPVVSGAWACVVPLRKGGGTRLKILEAMALGTPVVATSKGAEGLDVSPGENILIADEPEAFAHQVVRLIRSAELRNTLAVNGRQLVEQRYSWAQIGEEFRMLVEETADV